MRSWTPRSPSLKGPHAPPDIYSLAVEVLFWGAASVPRAPQPSAVTYKRSMRNSPVYTQGGHTRTPTLHTDKHKHRHKHSLTHLTLSATRNTLVHTLNANTHPLILHTHTPHTHKQTHAPLTRLCTLVPTCTHSHTSQIHSCTRSPRMEPVA